MHVRLHWLARNVGAWRHADFHHEPNDGERRSGVTQTIAVGLVHFVAHTTAAQSLRVTAGKPQAQSVTQQTVPANDPWNAWVLEVGVNGSVNGERYYKSRDVNMELEANRITEQWKTEFGYSFSYRDNQATVQQFDASRLNVVSDTRDTNLQRDWHGQLLQVKSVTDHFSLGTYLEVAQQTFRNQSLRYHLRGAGCSTLHTVGCRRSAAREQTIR